MAGADEQHQHDRGNDEQGHDSSAGVDLHCRTTLAELAGDDDCDGHWLVLSEMEEVTEASRSNTCWPNDCSKHATNNCSPSTPDRTFVARTNV
jgi:hypothetical protein